MSDESVRGQIASNIENIGRILSTNRVVTDIGPLYSAASQCRGFSNPGMWGYNVNNLLFRAQGNLKKIPVNVEEISIRFSISIEGFCEPEEGKDPLTQLKFDISIYGRQLIQTESGDTSINTVICSWHLDRHIYSDSDNQPEFIHPLYHFQYGGNFLDSATDDDGNTLDFGSALVLDSPRIPHPPMDAIIGIDFILRNFISFPRLSFREEGAYINLLYPAQEHFWKPYADVLAANWQANAHLLPWPPSLLWPQLK